MLIETFTLKAASLAGKKSPTVFLKEQESFLRSFPVIIPILDSAMYPTQKLSAIVTRIQSCKDPVQPVKVKAPKAAKPGAAPSAPKAPKVDKPYTVVIFTNNGWEVDSVLSADKYGDAERLAHNRLSHLSSDSYAEIVRDKVMTKVGYDAAIKAVLAKRLGGKQSTRGTGKMQVQLTQHMNVHHDSCHFSHG
jgi:hypothetical protein